MGKLENKMREMMEPAKEFIKKYKNLEEVSDDEVIQYMFEISAEDKNAIREFFGVSPDQFKINNKKNVSISFSWEQDRAPEVLDENNIMENDCWEFESEDGDVAFNRYYPGHDYWSTEDYELNNENLADLICILKIMQYEYAEEYERDIAEFEIDGDGIYYDSSVIDIPEILRCLGVERVIPESEYDLKINEIISKMYKNIEEERKNEEERKKKRKSKLKN